MNTPNPEKIAQDKQAGERTQYDKWSVRITEPPIEGSLRRRKVQVVDSEGNVIANCALTNLSRPTSYYPYEVKFARLIAAAPELLEALRCVVNSGPLNNGMRDENTMDVARAAIAKAEGKQS